MDTRELRELVGIALMSHENCAHQESTMCYLLISAEVGLMLDETISEEKFKQIGTLIADLVLESLILKGMVEPSGIDENGEMLFGVTDNGNKSLEEARKEKNGE